MAARAVEPMRVGYRNFPDEEGTESWRTGKPTDRGRRRYRNFPDEEGTERPDLHRGEAPEIRYRNFPDEEGTERVERARKGRSQRPVTEIFPMRRELKAAN